MTGKQDTPQAKARKRTLGRPWKRREEQLAAARAALEVLENDALAGLLYEVLDRRRLDNHGNPKELPGLYQAATCAIGALLTPELELLAPIRPIVSEKDRATQAREHDKSAEADKQMAERLAAVGRGARVNAREQGTDNAALRELSLLVEGFAASEKPEAAAWLTRALESRFGRTIDERAVAAALSKPTSNGRTTDVAFAVGLVEGDIHDTADRADALKKLAKAQAR